MNKYYEKKRKKKYEKPIWKMTIHQHRMCFSYCPFYFIENLKIGKVSGNKSHTFVCLS